MVPSHGDADHIGGLIDMLQSAIQVKSMIYNGEHRDTSTYLTLLAEMQSRGASIDCAGCVTVMDGQSRSWTFR
jgi:beta-lactamase superfamily II metal-dependent hydrolase